MDTLFKTVGEIQKGNTFFAHEDSSALEVASQLVNSRYTGMPVVDKKNRVIGIVSEQDILKAFRGSKQLKEIKIKNIMTSPPIVIKEDTTLEAASKILEDQYIQRLPVVKDGILIGTITRHDLIRAWIGLPPS